MNWVSIPRTSEILFGFPLMLSGKDPQCREAALKVSLPSVSSVWVWGCLVYFWACLAFKLNPTCRVKSVELMGNQHQENPQRESPGKSERIGGIPQGESAWIPVG